MNSKIKIAQIVSVVAILIVLLGGKELTPEEQTALVAGIAIVIDVVTWVFRKWFNHLNTQGTTLRD